MILCCGEKSKKPYIVEDEGVNIYSIEELCFYLIHYPEYVLTDLFSERLFEWMEYDAHLPSVSKKLRSLDPSDDKYYQRAARVVFEESGYATEREKESVLSFLNVLTGMTDEERKKAYADGRLKEGKIYRAIKIYNKILGESKNIPDALRADILHNLGTAYAKLFLFDTAADFFKRANIAYPNEIHQEAYKRALYLYEDDKERLLHENILSGEDLGRIGKTEKDILAFQFHGDRIKEAFSNDAQSITQETISAWKADYLKRMENGILAKAFWDR